MEFRDIQLNDKSFIDSVFSQFPPYCDFSFANLYNWRPGNKITQINILDGNLVIRAADLVTFQYEVSILGRNNIPKCIDYLISKFNHLSLVPEDVLLLYPEADKNYIVEEDFNNDDYIVSSDQIILLEGKKYAPKRNQLHKFLKSYAYEIITYDSALPNGIFTEMLELYKTWLQKKSIDPNSKTSELEALKLLIKHKDLYTLSTILIYADERLIAFSINEGFENGYSLCCFAKNNYDYRGSSEFLMYITAKHLRDLGYKYISYEQDLGIQSMRYEKLSWHPDHMLKKFKIRSRKI